MSISASSLPQLLPSFAVANAVAAAQGSPYGSIPVAAAMPTAWNPTAYEMAGWAASPSDMFLNALAQALMPVEVVTPQAYMPQAYVSPSMGGAMAAPVAPVAPVAAEVVPMAPVTASVAPPPEAVAATYASASVPISVSDVAPQNEPAPPKPKRKRKRSAAQEVWAGVKNPNAAHVSQVQSRFNLDPASGNRDCGPASAVIALHMLGMKVPGAANASPQDQINRIRQLAGVVSNSTSTSNFQLEDALTKSGVTTSEISSIDEVEAAIIAGKPVILNGNPANPGAYGDRVDDGKVVPFDGAHWIAVTGFDKASGKFLINDPLSKVGAVKVSREELNAYLGGSLGIVVSG